MILIIYGDIGNRMKTWNFCTTGRWYFKAEDKCLWTDIIQNAVNDYHDQ